MTFTVFGTGAVGAYYGGRLAQGGNKVHFLARSDFQTIKDEGLKVTSPDGDIFIEEPLVFNDPRDVPEADVIIISLKTTGNAGLRDQLMPLVRPGTVLLILQNGLGMEEEMHGWFPDNPVIGGMCLICSRKVGPGTIEHQDKGSITFGSLHDADIALRDDIGRIFSDAGIAVTIIDDLKEARWRKLLWNIPYNGLSVSLNKNTHQLMTDAQSRAMVEKLMDEVLAGADACGCKIEKEAKDQMLHFTKVMTPYDPSMKLDFMAGRSMEIEYMYDRPLAAAAAAGYDMRYTRELSEKLKIKKVDKKE